MSDTHFTKAFTALVERWEKWELTDDPVDRGGQTYAGISRKHNPDWGGWAFVDEKKMIHEDMVRRLYRQKYWNPLWEELPFPLADALFDTAVTSGMDYAVQLLQIAIDDRREVDRSPFPELLIDGDYGPKTHAAALQCKAAKVRRLMQAGRLADRLDDTDDNPEQLRFIDGWIRRIRSKMG